MKIIVIGNTSLISSAYLEQYKNYIQLIINTRERWPHWGYVGTSFELDREQPNLYQYQCGAFDILPEDQDGDAESSNKATLVLLAENEAEKSLLDAGSIFHHLEKDQLVTVWLKDASDSPAVELASFKKENS